MSYCVFDLETTGTTSYKRFCNPLDPRHSITTVAFKLPKQEAIFDFNKTHYETGLKSYEVFRSIDLNTIKVLVGHNIKFDLLWIWPELTTWIQNGGRIWDTMLAEYLLNGQEGEAHAGLKKNSISLNALALKYGGTLKDDRIGKMFKQGLKANEIPPDLLKPYNIEDVKNTELILKKQIKRAKQEGMLPLLQVHMDHLMAVCEEEYNGLFVSKERLEAKITEYREKRQLNLDQFLVKISPYWDARLPDFNIQSDDYLRAVLFGGEVKYIIDAPVVDDEGLPLYFKTGKRAGQQKTKKTEQLLKITGLGLPTKGLKTTETGKIQLSALALDSLESQAPELIQHIKVHRRLTKLLSTYLESDDGEKGMKLCIHLDNCIHSEFKLTLTPTSRISSTNPNVQNLDPEILDIFVGGPEEDDIYIESDFSQIEIAIQAFITQDEQFIKDVEKGRDFHIIRLSYVNEKEYDELVELCATSNEYAKKRKQSKAVSFAKAYGAGIKKIAKASGLTEEQVQEIFNKEDERYPQIKEYYDNLLAELDSNAVPLRELIPIRCKDGTKIFRPGEHARKSQFRTILGKKYTLYQLAVLTENGNVFRYWHDPSLKNYPIQGTANDIFKMQVGTLFRKHAIFNRHRYLLRNEIHDSITLSCKKDEADEIISEIEPILKDIKGNMKKIFGIDFNITIGVDSKKGRSLADCKNV